MKKVIKFLPFLAFVVAATVAVAFPPGPTPYGSTASIPCESGTIIDSDNCSTSGSDQCQVLLQGTYAVDAFANGNCNDNASRLKRN